MARLHRGHACHLCGVPFSIGRMRNAFDPPAAAFNTLWYERYEGGRDYPYMGWRQWAGGCGQNSGCVTAFHYERIMYYRALRKCVSMDRGRPFISPYLEIAGIAKPLPGVSLPDFDSDRPPTGTSPSEYLRVIPGSGQTEKLLHIGDYTFWTTNNIAEVIQQRLQEEGFKFDCTGYPGNVFPTGTFEHIAGPGCQATGRVCGYSGHSITYDEISMCRVAQHLNLNDRSMRDRPNVPLIDDEDWERLPDAEWVLGGLTHATSQLRSSKTIPQRLPIRVQPRSETSWDWPADRGTAMVFHPTCLEVFKRVAIQRRGSFDINRLGRWFVATCNFTVLNFPRHAALKRAVKGGEWYHHLGDDWITANPCYVGGLESLIQSLSCTSNVQQTGLQGDSTLLEQVQNVHIRDSDCEPTFASLPIELYDLIFNALSIGAIARIALACPALTQIAHEYICRHVVSDWPFIWELWCRRPYSKWTTKRHCDLIDIYEQFAPDLDRQSPLFSPIAGESAHLTGIPPESVFERSGFVPQSASHLDIAECTGPGFIRFIAALDTHIREGSLKGLRNRQRIWRDCELILDQIEILETGTHGDWDVLAMQDSGRWNQDVSDAWEALLYGQLGVQNS